MSSGERRDKESKGGGGRKSEEAWGVRVEKTRENTEKEAEKKY